MIVVTLDDETAKDLMRIIERLYWDRTNPSLLQHPLIIVNNQIEEQLISQAKAQTKGEK